MPTVCQVLNDLGFRIEDLERRLAAIRLYSTSQEGVNFHGTTWEVSGDQIAVWSSATNRPLSWSQGQWARLSAGKIEARGDAFTFKSSDTGARIEIDGTELAGYSSGGTKEFYISAADGKAYFAGGNAVMDSSGMTLTERLFITRTSDSVAAENINAIELYIHGSPGAASSTGFQGIKAVAQSGTNYDMAAVRGLLGDARHSKAGSVSTVEGVYARVLHNGALSGDVTDAAAIMAIGNIEASGSVTNFYLFRGHTSVSGDSTVTNAYGLYLPAMGGTTNSYGVWQDSASDLNVFKGPIWLDNKLYFDSAKEDYLEYTSDELNFYVANGLRAVMKGARFDLAVDMQQTGGSNPHKWGHGGTDLDIQFNSANLRTLDIVNIGAGAATLKVNGVSVAAGVSVLSDLTDVIITSVADNEVLAHDSGGNWINQTAAEAGLATSSHVHATGDVTSGTFADTRIAQSNITQHVAAIDHDSLLNFLAGEHFLQSAITQVGTIATGLWQGTAVADGYISSAATWNAKQNALTFGIADTNSVVIDFASVADNDYAKFTASGLEGRNSSEVKTDLNLDSVENTALSTWAGTSNITTLGTIGAGIWQGTAILDTYIDAGITLTNITQITNRSHTNLSDIGTNTHAQVDTHIGRTDNPHSVTAAQVGIADENRPMKVTSLEYQTVQENTWQTLIDLTDEGNMSYIWLTIESLVGQDATDNIWKHELKIIIDGTIRVDTNLGNFFASAYGSPKWTVDHIGCNYMNMADGAASYYRYVSIPFATSLKIELKNINTTAANDLQIWSQIGWYDGAGTYGARSNKFRCATLEAQSVAQYASKDLIDISGKGKLSGFMLAVDGNSNWTSLEGDIEIWIDGTKTIEYSGTEDAFLGAFYWGQVKWQTNQVGMTKQHTFEDTTDVYKMCAYRFFRLDPIPFDTSLKIVWYNGESGQGGGVPGTVEMFSEVWYYLE